MSGEVTIIDLRVNATPIQLSAENSPINLRVAPAVQLAPVPNPIELQAAVEVMRLSLAGTIQGPPGKDGEGAEQFGAYETAQIITSSSLTHIATDGKLYLADYELDRPANSFTISGYGIGQIVSVYRSGLLNGLGGIEVGRDYWLGNAGQVRSTCPDHGVTQRCGTGASATELIVSLFEDVDWE